MARSYKTTVKVCHVALTPSVFTLARFHVLMCGVDTAKIKLQDGSVCYLRFGDMTLERQSRSNGWFFALRGSFPIELDFVTGIVTREKFIIMKKTNELREGIESMPSIVDFIESGGLEAMLGEFTEMYKDQITMFAALVTL